MSNIYTANPVEAKTIQHPEFTKRDLKGMTSGQLERIHMVGVPGGKQLAYDGYIRNLPAFLHATAVHAKVSCTQQWFKAKLPSALIIPLPLPTLTISSPVALKKEEQEEAFKASLGVAVETTRGPLGKAYIIRHPTYSLLKVLAAKVHLQTPSLPDATSFFGITSYITTIRILSLFLSVHTYPAYQTAGGDYSDYMHDIVMDYPYGYHSPGRNYFGLGKDVANPDGVAYDDLPSLGLTGVDDHDDNNLITSGQGVVLVAKPAPLRPSINYGNPTSVPNLPGYVFPYFHNLVAPGKDTLINVMHSYFLGCFGDSMESGQMAWKDWMRGVDKWYRTREGLQLAHIFFVLRLALEAQGRLYILLGADRKYLGCAILGHRFVINNGGSIMVAYTGTQLRNACIALDEHSKAIETITGVLSELRLASSDGTGMTADLPTIQSSRQLFVLMNQREKPGDDETMKILADAIDRLAFSEDLWPFSLDKILTWIEYLVDDTKDIPNTWPMYLSSRLMYEKSRAHQIMSAFGPMAPSLLDQGGQEYPIPKGLAAEDAASVEDPTSRQAVMSAVLISGKKLDIAINDCLSMVKKRRIRQNLKERAAGYRTIKFTGQGRDKIWNALKLLPFEEEGKGKKRARDDDEEEDRPNKRSGLATSSTSLVDDTFFD
jgi:hypothetical protein